MLPHPLADLFPRLDDDGLAGLAADIKKNGLLDPITILDGQILDGRNRYAACGIAGVDPRCVEFEGTDPLAFVIAKNLSRRHLDESQRAMVAARIAALPKGANQHAPIGAPSQPEAAAMLNVARRSVQRARVVMESGDDDLIDAVDSGKIAVSHAAKIATHPKGVQRAVVEKVTRENLKPQEAWRRVKADTIAKKESAAPSGKYRVIYADPPWSYGNTSLDEYVEQRDHYPVMSLADICALPIKAMAQDDAVLFLWATSPILEEAFEVINAWGFKYKASFVWDKIAHNMGHYNSVRHEFLLVCVKGSCQPDVRKLFDSVVSVERTEHSKKPEAFREIIDAIYTQGARVELFARQAAVGWERWGYEA